MKIRTICMALGILASLQARALTGLTNWEYMWPKMRVPYVFNPGVNAGLRGRLRAAMDHWEANTRFRFIPIAAGSEKYYLYVTTALPGMGDNEGRTFVGKNHKCGKSICESFMHLGEDTETGILIHELGHAVGLYHEQVRLDRDKHVVIHPDNISNWGSGAEINFQLYTDRDDYPKKKGGYWGPYDFGSIMHYGSYTGTEIHLSNVAMTFLTGFFKQWHDPAMTDIYGDTFGEQRDGLSTTDKDNIYNLYAPYCGGTQSKMDQSWSVPSQIFDFKVDLCQTRKFSYVSDDYMDLSLSLKGYNNAPLNDSALTLRFSTYEWELMWRGDKTLKPKLVPGSNNVYATADKTLPPGKQSLVIASYLQEKLNIGLNFQMKKAAVLKDKYEANGGNDTLSTPKTIPGAVYDENFFLAVSSTDELTLDHADDKDYYVIDIPTDSLAEKCSPYTAVYEQKETGLLETQLEASTNLLTLSSGEQETTEETQKITYAPGALSIGVGRKDINRELKLSVYDISGNFIESKVFKDGADGKAWKRDRFRFVCPHQKFPGSKLIVKVEDLKKKRNIYKLAFHFIGTSEIRPEKDPVNTQDYDMGLFIDPSTQVSTETSLETQIQYDTQIMSY